MNDFETMMNSSTYADPVNGYQKYIDVNSFVDFFIINELSKNIDSYRLSTYMYKKSIIEGGQLVIGPVWDYDIAWHNCDYNLSFDHVGWTYQMLDNTYPVPNWWTKLMSDDAFKNKVKCRWNSLRQTILSTGYLNNYIDNAAAALSESQQRNFRQWPTIGAYIYPNPQNQTGASYAGEIADLKTWIANRTAWMDANLPGDCTVGLKEQFVNTNLLIYPNPMETQTTFSMKLEKESDISLCITDLVGREVSRYLSTNVPQGESHIVLNRNQMQSGIYIYQLEINNTVTTGKIIVQ